MAGRVGFEPTTHNVGTAEYTLGGLYDHLGNTYMYVLITDQAVTSGECLEFASATDGYTVSAVRAGSAVGRKCAGVAVGTISNGNYGFIMVRGTATVLTDGTVAQGNFLSTSPGTDSVCTPVSTNEEASFGMALVTDSGATPTCLARINCM